MIASILLEVKADGLRKLRGPYQYYAVNHNYGALSDVHHHVKRSWQYWLSKRSHKGIVRWDWYMELISKKFPLPRPRILHQI